MLSRLTEWLYRWFFECEDDVFKDTSWCDTLMGCVQPGERIERPCKKDKRKKKMTQR